VGDALRTRSFPPVPFRALAASRHPTPSSAGYSRNHVGGSDGPCEEVPFRGLSIAAPEHITFLAAVGGSPFANTRQKFVLLHLAPSRAAPAARPATGAPPS